MTGVVNPEPVDEEAARQGADAAAARPTAEGEHAEVPETAADSRYAPRPVNPPEARNAEIVERATVDERRIYQLEERLEEVETRLRERTEMYQQRELELRALERDLAVKEGYARHLELQLAQALEAGERRAGELQHTLDLTYNHARNLEAMIANHEAEMAAVHAAEQAALDAVVAAEAHSAELGALVAAIQSQASYKIAARVAERLKRAGPLYSVIRRAARATLGG